MPIDDLGQVCLRAGIDRSTYRSFPMQLNRREHSGALQQEAVTAKTAVQNRFSGTVREPAEAPGTTGTGHTRDTESYSVLAAVLQSGVSRASQADAVRLGLQLHGAGGGVGVTTVAATLARCWSAGGKRVLMLDVSEQSLLSLYLGDAEPASGPCSFPARLGSSHGDIAVCANAISAPPEHEYDAVIADAGGASVLEQAGPAIEPATAAIVILVPDLRCVLRVKALERRISAQSRQKPVYVLNQFQPGLGVHQDIRSWLGNLVGNRLSPVSLSLSPEVSQALAQGHTVLDYAPESNFAREIKQLGNWIEARRV